mgnify:CR=1 FL=1
MKKYIENLLLSKDGLFPEKEIVSFKLFGKCVRRLSTVYFLDVSFASNINRKYCLKSLSDNVVDGKKKIINEYNSNLFVYENFEENNVFRIVKPIYVDPQEKFLITEFFENGKTIESFLVRNIYFGNFENIRRIIFSCGFFLRKYHGVSVSVTTFEKKIMQDLKKYLIVRLEKICTYAENNGFENKFSHKEIERFCLRYDELLNGYEPRPEMFSLIHGDFTPANILYDKSSFSLIDFSDSKISSKYQDIGCFLNYLRMLSLNKPFISEKKIELLQLAFLQGYDDTNTEGHKLIKVYQYRYLLTNLISQINELQSAPIKSVYLKSRIVKYMNSARNHFKSLN